MPPPPRHRRHVPISDIARVLDPARLDAMLEALIPDPKDRSFVVRCVVGEGPMHHRGANWVLLTLLSELADTGSSRPSAPGQVVKVRMRMPPHLEDEVDEGDWPVALDLEALLMLAPQGSRELEALVDCLVDGPAHHALANVLMVNLLGRLVRARGDKV